MSKRTPWTAQERDDFVAWHESVIAAYPDELRKEMQRARHKFMASVRVLA